MTMAYKVKGRPCVHEMQEEHDMCDLKKAVERHMRELSETMGHNERALQEPLQESVEGIRNRPGDD